LRLFEAAVFVVVFLGDLSAMVSSS